MPHLAPVPVALLLRAKVQIRVAMSNSWKNSKKTRYRRTNMPHPAPVPLALLLHAKVHIRVTVSNRWNNEKQATDRHRCPSPPLYRWRYYSTPRYKLEWPCQTAEKIVKKQDTDGQICPIPPLYLWRYYSTPKYISGSPCQTAEIMKNKLQTDKDAPARPCTCGVTDPSQGTDQSDRVKQLKRWKKAT